VRHCTGVTTSREGLTEPAIERLYSELAPKVWRACLAYSGSRDVADEAVAEAFTLAMEHADELRSPAGWIWKVAIRLAGAERERRRGLGEPIPDEAYEMPDPAVELIRALARLSERQRAAVLLHHYADRPISEIADILGTSSQAIRVHLLRGRRRLRRLLEDDDG